MGCCGKIRDEGLREEVFVCVCITNKSQEGLQQAQLFHTHPDVIGETEQETCTDPLLYTSKAVH